MSRLYYDVEYPNGDVVRRTESETGLHVQFIRKVEDPERDAEAARFCEIFESMERKRQ